MSETFSLDDESSFIHITRILKRRIEAQSYSVYEFTFSLSIMELIIQIETSFENISIEMIAGAGQKNHISFNWFSFTGNRI